MKKPLLIILVILIFDQALKIWIKTNMELRDSIQIFDWFQIYYTENPGMAFGLQFGGSWGKLALSIFRVFAIAGLFYWLRSLVRSKAGSGAIIAVSMVTAGALGNMVDSAFYGLLFDKGLSWSAELGSWVGYSGLATWSTSGYASLLQGCVVDMLYFPIWEGVLPEWIPFKGGDYFIFFRPIFNLADVSISCGVGLLILFQKKVFPSR